MLGKLLKYEIPAMGRKLLPLYAAWAVTAVEWERNRPAVSADMEAWADALPMAGDIMTVRRLMEARVPRQ